MNKFSWLFIVTIFFSIISIASLFIGDKLPDSVLAIVLIGLIPISIILGIISLWNKKTKKGLMIPLLALVLFAAVAHLSIQIPFYMIGIVASLVYIISRVNKYKQQGEINILREVGISLFFIYLLAVFKLTFSPFQFIAPYKHIVEMEWTPFKEITEQFGRTPRLARYYAVGNIIMTIPFGLFIPLLFKRLRSFGVLILCGFGFSFLIESLQMLFTNRSAEVDDLIFNTIGAVIGYLIFIALKRFVTLANDRR